MQQKNLILFIAVCLIIVIGWPMLMNQFIRKPPPKDGTQPGGKSPPSVANALALYSAGPSTAAPGVAVNFALAFLARDAAQLATRLRSEHAWRDLPDRDKLRILAAVQMVAVPSITSFSLFEALTTPRVVAKGKPAAEPKTYILGGGKDDYLRVKLTTRGAGIQELILNRFEAATREGRPAGHELALIQDDPLRASFLMYQYLDPEKAEPVDTLGKALWEYKEGDSSHHVFSIARGDLVITKTYRLAPRTYHVTLTLQFEHKGQPGKAEPIKFRYQLAGPHGMPIEGIWYTPIYRNPVMAVVNSRDDTLREDVEQGETQYRISHRKGGDKVPESLASGSYIQYGGVAIQYFASLIVPDNQQPPPEQGGVNFRQILSYLRPTLETEEMRGQVRAVGRDELVLHPRLEAWDLRGEITKISEAADKPELVLSTGGKEDRIYTFHLLRGAREALQKEGLRVGSKVVVSYDTKGDERSAFDIRRENVPRTFRLLPRAVEQIGKENLD
jgi:hypothetical protein